MSEFKEIFSWAFGTANMEISNEIKVSVER